MNVSRQPAAGQTEHRAGRAQSRPRMVGVVRLGRSRVRDGGREPPGVVDWATSGVDPPRAGPAEARVVEGSWVVGMRRQRRELTEVEVVGVVPRHRYGLHTMPARRGLGCG